MDIENHPIPQDITGFQFKLIGSMTIKQFAYLAGGFIIAWLFYASPLFFIIKMFFAIVFAAAGASLAFLPVSGRPLDIMIVNFIKAVFKPTQYVYQQTSPDLAEKEIKNLQNFNKKRRSISEMSDQQLQEFLNTLPKSTNKLDQKEMVFFQNINQYQAPKSTSPLQNIPGYVATHAYANTAPQPNTSQSLPPITQAGGQPQQQIKPTISPTAQPPKENLSQPSTQATQPPQANINSQEYLAAHQKVLELQQSLNEMMMQKQQLEEKLTGLQKQADTQNQTTYVPSIAQPEPPQQTQLVRSVPQNMAKSVGLVTPPEYPNIISGIIKDPRGNPLSNILVEIKDSQGNAVRAFKTNALGQFASATPLSNGDYTVEFDDPREQNKFVNVAFKATGEIILPIEVISVDTREELRRSLFN